jgi:hypothetical protein
MKHVYVSGGFRGRQEKGFRMDSSEHPIAYPSRLIDRLPDRMV